MIQMSHIGTYYFLELILFITVYVPKCLSDIVSGLIEYFEILYLKVIGRPSPFLGATSETKH